MHLLKMMVGKHNGEIDLKNWFELIEPHVFLGVLLYEMYTFYVSLKLKNTSPFVALCLVGYY